MDDFARQTDRQTLCQTVRQSQTVATKNYLLAGQTNLSKKCLLWGETRQTWRSLQLQYTCIDTYNIYIYFNVCYIC